MTCENNSLRRGAATPGSGCAHSGKALRDTPAAPATDPRDTFRLGFRAVSVETAIRDVPKA
ncbi:hypothetical protein GCM10023082_40150 [Streptomyces tremellae]|uniref:Uncharacterized protein n=1 Tax=Streptomyces tremellae TaxID=1124239 RepID=A0ABP7FH33_9ACTN